MPQEKHIGAKTLVVHSAVYIIVDIDHLLDGQVEVGIGIGFLHEGKRHTLHHKQIPAANY